MTETVFSLQASLAQCQVTLAENKARVDEFNLNLQSKDIQSKHNEIEAEILKFLNAKEDEVLDWVTLTLKKKTEK